MVVVATENRVAVVTGAASGIGRATAQRLLQADAKVVIADVNRIGAERTAEELSGIGECLPFAVDVTSSEQVTALFAYAEARFGAVHVLSHNAGLAGYPTPALDAGEDQFDQILAVNVKGAWLCARAAVPAMQRAGRGSIVLTGSIMGERARPGFGAYASSKAAVNHLTRTLALEWAPTIRVNAVAPVATDTAMLPQFLGPDDPDVARERFIASIPLGRLAQPEDVAEAIAFLASDAAAFLTGVVLPVDGGRSI
jgi:3-oxoacyl-[acyl-carrier protein] reductase